MRFHWPCDVQGHSGSIQFTRFKFGMMEYLWVTFEYNIPVKPDLSIPDKVHGPLVFIKHMSLDMHVCIVYVHVL